MLYVGLGMILFGVSGIISGRKNLKEIDLEMGKLSENDAGWYRITRIMVNRKVQGGITFIITGIIVVLAALFN